MSLFMRLSRMSRQRKMELFFSVMKPSQKSLVLDVGGETYPEHTSTLQFVDLYPQKKNLSVVNMSHDRIKQIKETYPEVNAVVGDACALPWTDKYFDVVFSNAVIEHVGDLRRQRKMASEVMRVGRKWFVTTPNRLFPYEFHLRLPFVTWLPGRLYVKIGRIVSYNHVKQKYMRNMRPDGIRLMTARELAICFPGSKIARQRITFIAETLIVIGGE